MRSFQSPMRSSSQRRRCRAGLSCMERIRPRLRRSTTTPSSLVVISEVTTRLYGIVVESTSSVIDFGTLIGLLDCKTRMVAWKGRVTPSSLREFALSF